MTFNVNLCLTVAATAGILLEKDVDHLVKDFSDHLAQMVAPPWVNSNEDAVVLPGFTSMNSTAGDDVACS